MFIFKYIKKSDNSLIGYHQSTFCQITENRDKAKRYETDEPEKQLETIQKNFNFVMSRTEESKGFDALSYASKKSCFDGLTVDDVEIQFEEY